MIGYVLDSTASMKGPYKEWTETTELKVHIIEAKTILCLREVCLVSAAMLCVPEVKQRKKNNKTSLVEQ